MSRGALHLNVSDTLDRRKQYLHEASRVPTFARLYAVCLALYHTSSSYPLCSRLWQWRRTLRRPSPNSKNLYSLYRQSFLFPSRPSLMCRQRTNTAPHNAPSAAMRKRLLDSFAEYDQLAKRIRQLPAPRGGSQQRVQSAILTRANLFLQKNMFPLQVRRY